MTYCAVLEMIQRDKEINGDASGPIFAVEMGTWFGEKRLPLGRERRGFLKTEYSSNNSFGRSFWKCFGLAKGHFFNHETNLSVAMPYLSAKLFT